MSLHGRLLLTVILSTASVRAFADPAAFTPKSWAITLPAGCEAPEETMPANWLYDQAAQRAIKANRQYILKPSYENMPTHVWRDLRSCFPGDEFLPAQWRMLPVEAYTRIYDVDHNPQPARQAAFDEFAAWTRQGKPDKGWQFLPFLDMDTAFVVLPKRLQTKDFDGVRVVVQFDWDGGNIARAGMLLYVYQGLSADRSQFQLLIVPLAHPELPDAAAKEHLGVTWESLLQSRDAEAIYAERLTEWLDARAGAMQPTLATLDQMVLSVHAPR